MLYNLIEKIRGKEEIIMTDSLTKVRNRKKTIATSKRGQKVEYFIVESTDVEKFQKKNPGEGWRAGGYSDGPKIIK